jgi:exosortase E/protease (VPEID-CTERM system)
LADRILRLVYPEVVSDPDRFVLGTPSFRVRIASACSGYEGACLVTLYLAVYLVLFRRTLRFPHAVWLLPLGALSAWLLNVFRITTLVAIGDSGSPELALGGFHSQAGWLAFNAVALGLTFTAHRSRIFAAAPAHSGTGPDPTAAYLLPLLTLVTVQMLTEAFFNGSPALYPLRVVAGASVLCYLRRSITCSRYQPTREGSGGLLCAVLVGAGVFVLWIALDRLAPAGEVRSDPRSALAGMGNWVVAAWLMSRVVGSVLIVPLAEELAFRGYLIRRLIAADFGAVSPRRFTWASFLISSVLFGLLHGHWVAGMLAGMAYAAVLYRRGRLGDSVLAHATTNGLLTVVALASGDWSFWS